MADVFFNITWKQGKPSIEEICERYGFKADEIDKEFGIIEIDPEANLYTILVEYKAAQRVMKEYGDDQSIEGPFTNPPIAPFGPPKE